MSQHRIIGTNVPRKEGPAKLRGEARYIDDLTFPGMLHGATVRSTVARGTVKSIVFPDRIPWHEFTVVTAADIPGRNMVPMFLEDQPLLVPAGENARINHPEEPILLLAHPDRHRLAAAVAAVEIVYDELRPVFDVEEAAAGGEVIWGPADAAEPNTFKSFLLEQGDLDEAFARADLVVEGEYYTGAQEQLYIETNGVIAETFSDEHGGLLSITVWGSLQCPFYVHRALKIAFNLRDEQVRVVQAETGGAFGGKEDYPSIIAGHAALLALKAGRPVKIIYDRAEDMAATTKRHPSRTRHRTAVTRDGLLLGADIDFLIDGGAYATLSATVCSRGTIHAAGPYQWPALRVRSRAVATNTPPSGAFRGFGAPQALFALERHMDKVARAVGLTAEEFRRRNFLRPGGTTATGQIVPATVDLQALLTRALEANAYHEKTERFARENPASAVKRGIGFATFMHGAGFTGSGERYLNSLVGLEGTAEGRVRVLVSSSEFGQGTNTILAQVAGRGVACRLRAHRRGPAGHSRCAELRPNRGLAHSHDRGRPCRARRRPPARAAAASARASQQALLAEAQPLAVADDDVVVDHDGQHGQRALHLTRHVDVGAGGRRVAAGVVVHQDDGGRVQLQRALRNLPRVDGGVVDGAAGLRLVGQQAVAAVQEQDAELLHPLAREGGVEVVHQPVPVAQHGPVHHLGAHQAQGGGLHRLQCGGPGLAHALDRLQLGHRGGDGVGVAAEARQQRAGDGLGVAPGQGQEQHHLQQLVVRHAVRPGGQQPLAHPLPVPGRADGRWRPVVQQRERRVLHPASFDSAAVAPQG